MQEGDRACLRRDAKRNRDGKAKGESFQEAQHELTDFRVFMLSP
jgi:hypothetical protein